VTTEVLWDKKQILLGVKTPFRGAKQTNSIDDSWVAEIKQLENPSDEAVVLQWKCIPCYQASCGINLY